jgi:hypothetical protein
MLIIQCKKRKFTFETDKLVALQGIANQILGGRERLDYHFSTGLIEVFSASSECSVPLWPSRKAGREK